MCGICSAVGVCNGDSDVTAVWGRRCFQEAVLCRVLRS
jgi:hypothetical protein